MIVQDNRKRIQHNGRELEQSFLVSGHHENELFLAAKDSQVIKYNKWKKLLQKCAKSGRDKWVKLMDPEWKITTN